MRGEELRRADSKELRVEACGWRGRRRLDAVGERGRERERE